MNCAFSNAFDASFEICVPVDPHPIHRRRRRVYVRPPARRRLRARVESEIVVVSSVRAHVTPRFVYVPAGVASTIEIVGQVRAHIWRSGVRSEIVFSDMVRASVDNEAEVIGLALGLNFALAQELV